MRSFILAFIFRLDAAFAIVVSNHGVGIRSTPTPMSTHGGLPVLLGLFLSICALRTALIRQHVHENVMFRQSRHRLVGCA